jgi:hypothetical protein
MTWVLAAWSALFAILAVVLIAAMAISAGPGVKCTHRAYCVGATIPARAVLALVFLAWLVGLLVLSLIWLMTRRRPLADPSRRTKAERWGRPIPDWRGTTWAIVAWSALWAIVPLVEIAHSHGACVHRAHCGTTHHVAAAVEIAIGSFVLWLPGFLVLAVVWLARGTSSSARTAGALTWRRRLPARCQF